MNVGLRDKYRVTGRYRSSELRENPRRSAFFSIVFAVVADEAGEREREEEGEITADNH